MFRNQHFDRVREKFADQFEADGLDYIYRKGMKAAPIKVSAAERSAFIEDFNRRLNLMIWGLMAASLVLVVGFTVYTIKFDQEFSEAAIYVGIAIIMSVYMASYFRAWNAPQRELARRPFIGNPRTRDEIRKRTLQKMTYRQLAVAPVAAVALLFKISVDHDINSGWNRLWLVFAGLVAAAAAVQAFRKWRFDSSSRE